MGCKYIFFYARVEELPALNLKQAMDKKINGPIQCKNWREKFTNMVGDYEEEMYE